MKLRMRACFLVISAIVTTMSNARINWQYFEDNIVNSVCQIHVVSRKFDYVVPYRPRPFEESRGSGFFISSEGDIITNSHVVRDAVAAWITLPRCGKTKIPVEIRGQCPERDIARLKITPEGFDLVTSMLGVSELSYLSFGDSDAVHRMDKVYAIGYPLGQKRLKATKGVISGPEYFKRESYIQMDAPINPGNSGGPLLNRDGRVVGVTTAGVLGAQNVGYIVPINHVIAILDELEHPGFVYRPFLGVYCSKGSDGLADYLNNPIPSGLYINFVQPNSIAGNAGVKPGDMLYKIDGYDVDESGDIKLEWSSEKVPLHEIISRYKPGQIATLTVFREGEMVVLETRIMVPERLTFDYQFGPVDFEVIGGMTVMQLCENHFELFRPDAYLLEFAKPENIGQKALIVTSLVPGTEMSKSSHIFPGMLIDCINGKKVETLNEFREALLESKRTGILVVTARNGSLHVVRFRYVVEDQLKLIQDRICPQLPFFAELIRD